ncbi:hypothetical protein E2C01_005868 [Portunus trituberculatus]|uniref:Uncharacterized protein n=1 Tax=Portunus trituberculatus TaxID=210409 RepID=A0A5B7CTH9_PORTR|nr:hypothetical protein [Portunus trituberculatus]
MLHHRVAQHVEEQRSGESIFQSNVLNNNTRHGYLVNMEERWRDGDDYDQKLNGNKVMMKCGQSETSVGNVKLE